MTWPPLFDTSKCPAADVPRVGFEFIKDCRVNNAPPPIYDCPDIELPPAPPIPVLGCPTMQGAAGDIAFNVNVSEGEPGGSGTGSFVLNVSQLAGCNFAFDLELALDLDLQVPGSSCPTITGKATTNVGNVQLNVVESASCDYKFNFDFELPSLPSLSGHTGHIDVLLRCPYRVDAYTAAFPALRMYFEDGLLKYTEHQPDCDLYVCCDDVSSSLSSFSLSSSSSSAAGDTTLPGCEPCVDKLIARHYLIEIEGMAVGQRPECADACASLNGAYVVEIDTVGEAGCFGSLVIPGACQDSLGATCYRQLLLSIGKPTLSLGAPVRVRLGPLDGDTGAGECSNLATIVWQGYLSNPGQRAACLEFAHETLPFHSRTGAVMYCNPTGSTAYITALL